MRQGLAILSTSMNFFVQLLTVGAFFLVPFVTSAATLYLSPTETTLARGETKTFSMRLDVDEDECVNAIDAVVTYSPSLEPIDISRGQSIMSMWVEEPTIDRTNRTITFAGGIPNGYCGRIDGDPRLTNNIIDLVFQSPGFVIGGNRGTSTEAAEITIAEQTQVYLNDGFGTRVALNRYPAKITLLSEVGNIQNSAWGDAVAADDAAPESFSIALERTDNAFSGRWFITFNTTDKQSGLDHYEVMEEPLKDFWSFAWGAADAPWVEVRSPYELKDQSLNSTIRVRAIDKAGNEYIASLVPDSAQRTLSHSAVLTLIVVGVAVFFFVAVGLLIVVVRHIRRKRLVLVESAEDEGVEDNQNDEEKEILITDK